ncbi:MAG: prepilin-type N-terminal cleavage/methylation domain-containing protein [Oscillospiraceae bacterium]|jgi:prepilin-type N-terminal cleavage/methylation domain-containing protein|nr:prepilin-type N-terminal cleavage/methylation domain-containing protein [Oscillospiraceae bacterium]
MKRDSKGFSLIELIVVIALLAALAAVVASSLTPLFSSRAQRAASSANALIAKCKVFSMGRKGDVYLRIYKDGSGEIVGEYYENGAVAETEILGGKSTDISPAGGVTIAFERATGGLKPDSDSAVTFSAGGKTYAVEIIRSTGKHGVARR